MRTNLFGRRINVGKDEIYFYNKEREDDKLALEQERKRAEQERKRAEQAEADNEKLRKEIEALHTKYGES